jgi:hypothetical protein
MRDPRLIMLAAVLLCHGGCSGGTDQGEPATVKAVAENCSTATLCAEQDNVNVALTGSVRSFVVEATHPTYQVGTDDCTPNFRDCPDPSAPMYPFAPHVYKLFDDGETVIEAVREASWWRPRGMSARVDAGDAESDIHYVCVSRKVLGANEWPQFMVLYMDGNMRLIPHPPVGRTRVCFGSSVIIGPAAVADRPIAEIASVRYLSSSKTMEITYREGGSARLALQDVSRQRARVVVTVNYPTDAEPFATFRSMFVENGNADVDHVRWTEPEGTQHDAPIAEFRGGEGTTWLFHRTTRSRHNTSAPDIRIQLLR